MRVLAISAMAVFLNACVAMTGSSTDRSTDRSGTDAGLADFFAEEYKNAAEKLTPPAEQTDPRAQFALGIVQINGSAAAEDDSAAVRWLVKLADRRNPYARSVLGSMYMDGRGVARDYVKAHMWFDLAVAEFDYESGRHYAERLRDALARKMTRDEIVEARKMAQTWLRSTEADHHGI